jgi:hypothetical protein
MVIDDVFKEDIGDGTKPVVHFRDQTKGLVLNATNFGAIANQHGDETDDWRGKAVTLYPTRVGKRVDAIRIRTVDNRMMAAENTEPPAYDCPEAEYDDAPSSY